MTISQTSAAIGATGQFLEGTSVSTAAGENLFRESVVIAGPESSDAYVNPVSSQPVDQYGVPVWMQGTTQVNIVSSIPLGFTPTGTSMVNIVSSVPLIISSTVPQAIVGTSQVFGTVSTQVVSSIPFYVSQSTSPWVVSGSTQIVSSIPLNIGSTVPQALVGTSMVNIVSSIALNVNMLGTTLINVVSSVVQGVTITSSLPLIVAQSSAPWSFVETTSLTGGPNVTTRMLLATLNTTVIKASAGSLYGITGSNVGSSNVFVRLYNLSTAALTIASTAVPTYIFGLPVSTSPTHVFDMGMTFSSGISMITQQQPFTATNSIAVTASTCVINIMYA